MTTASSATSVVVALKWSARRRHVDPVTGVVSTDPRSMGLTDMDEAALEWALRMGNDWGTEVVAVTVGPPAAEGALQVALASGVDRAIRVDAPETVSPAEVAKALADVVHDSHPMVAVTGVHGVNRASASVPAFLAHWLGAEQALGLVDVDINFEEPGMLTVLRRVDGGARERLRVSAPAVISVEGSTATLRRASLKAMLGADVSSIHVASNRVAPGSDPTVGSATTRPYRPRTQLVPAPQGDSALDRILELTDAATPRTPPRTVELQPVEAAVVILDQLEVWGVDALSAGVDGDAETR